ncbi:radical SAM superfamily enzyme [Paramagnetospirillum caucaseum]|uniref:Radical SAM superfamily enzyme n=1 Tax=Paramagnetospirillum caucaseum TaxID=1244869 RepID=M3ACM4_9PROT|nr:radical SAM/SPASM domain-containing protein [Paramagnetospirillum caucaseum]EME70543.1 radical SAM superfamily enzyme [Paramagnetospirillum caucaseum]
MRAIVNNYLLEDELLVRRFKRHPHTLHLHPTNICNARCVFCSYRHSTEEKIVAETREFCRAIDDWMSKVTGDTRLEVGTNNGDALVDPDLITKLRYAKDKGVTTIFFPTNGILLKRGNLCEELVQVVDNIAISIPGFDREDYKLVYGVDKADEVLEGVIKLAEAKRAANSPIKIELYPRIDRPWEEVLQDEGMKRLEPYIADGTLIIPPEQIRNEEMFTWGGVITDDDMPGTMKLRHREFDPKRRPCRNPLKDVSILPDGQVRVCSCQYMNTNYDELVIGDTREASLDDILFAPRHRQVLKDMASGNWAPVCANCSIFEPVRLSLRESFAWTLELIRLRLARRFGLRWIGE